MPDRGTSTHPAGVGGVLGISFVRPGMRGMSAAAASRRPVSSRGSPRRVRGADLRAKAEFSAEPTVGGSPTVGTRQRCVTRWSGNATAALRIRSFGVIPQISGEEEFDTRRGREYARRAQSRGDQSLNEWEEEALRAALHHTLVRFDDGRTPVLADVLPNLGVVDHDRYETLSPRRVTSCTKPASPCAGRSTACWTNTQDSSTARPPAMST